MSATPASVDTLVYAGNPSWPRATGLLAQRGAVLGGALLLTLAQVVVVSLAGGYRGLHQWDSNWYARIAAEGYPDDLPRERERMAEVGFFPGYPLAVRAVVRATGLPVETATLMAAQLAACGVWVYVLLFLRRGRVPIPLAAAAVLLLVTHPSAFFLAAGYSESLFLCATLGFLYWSSARGRAGWLLAALHGIVMTATRIVGLPLAACPLLLALAALPWGERRWGDVVRAGLLGCMASLGGLLFFAFCQWQYGRWDAYLYAQVAGWGVTPDYLALFKSAAYRFDLALLLPDGTLNPNALSRWAVPLTVLLFGGLVLAELRLGRGTTSEGRRERAGLILAAGVMFYIAASGTAFSGFIGLLRYSYCAHVALVLAAAHLLGQVPAVRERAWRAALATLAPAVPSLVIQLMLIRQFTNGEWVA
jgi:hypothetical protein